MSKRIEPEKLTQNAKAPLSKEVREAFGLIVFEKSYPGIELVSQAASRSLYSPQMRFTTEFEMGRSGATSP